MMAVVHDLAEALVGDIAPSDGVSKEEKTRLEAVNEFQNSTP
jgi:putative hydrolases of HD superfamily